MRIPVPVVPLLVATSLLSACGKLAPTPPPARAALAPAGALNAGGEPQWSAILRHGLLRLTTGDGAVLAVKASVEDHGKAGAVWSGPLPAAAGRPAAMLRLAAESRPCQDASTGLGYPFTATVEAAGRRYTGCAALPGQGLGPRT